MAMIETLDAVALREALLGLPDVAAQESLSAPALESIYLPRGHIKALSLDASIVVGMRGAGKSFWTAVLASKDHPAWVEKLSGRSTGLHVRVGYGLDLSGKYFPSEGILKTLLERELDPFVIWQTVVLRHALAVCNIRSELPEGWTQAVAWCGQEAETVSRLFAECDQILVEQGKPLLVLFDALDRMAQGWSDIRKLLKGALRLCLECRSRRMIRLKFFLRPDMEEDPEIWEFRDSSKLKSSSVTLEWRKADLYGLILHMLGNAPEIGPHFRSHTQVSWPVEDGVYSVPSELINNEAAQKEIIGKIAGIYMGTNARRGYTYTWIPTHLADAMGRVSPRSFLLAFKKAAEKTREHYSSHGVALHYLAIQDGVVHASRTRVDEIREDYPWIKPVLEACRGLIVPTESREFTQNWNEQIFKNVEKEGAEKLPPRRFVADPLRQGQKEALLDDLVGLAVVYRSEGDRINMPDIFRVAFGIKRKGGVKPPR